MNSAPPVASTAAEVITLLRDSDATVATAESLTGGLVAAALTAVPGASAVFVGGVVAYTRAVKVDLLGVDAQLLEREGAVHPEVALEMAARVRCLVAADWGVATTGVAGPDPSDGKSVGNVFVAISGLDGDEIVALMLSGDREAIRAQTVSACLDRLSGRVRAFVTGSTGYRWSNALPRTDPFVD